MKTYPKRYHLRIALEIYDYLSCCYHHSYTRRIVLCIDFRTKRKDKRLLENNDEF